MMLVCAYVWLIASSNCTSFVSSANRNMYVLKLLQLLCSASLCCCALLTPELQLHGSDHRFWHSTLLLQVRALDAKLHPKWNGKLGNGWDAALVQLPEDSSIKAPALAANSFELIHSTPIHVLKFDNICVRMLNMAIVKNELCPGLKNLAQNMLCAYSENAQVAQGSVWGKAAWRQNRFGRRSKVKSLNSFLQLFCHCLWWAWSAAHLFSQHIYVNIPFAPWCSSRAQLTAGMLIEFIAYHSISVLSLA